MRAWARPASSSTEIYSLGAVVLKSTGVLEAVAITSLPIAWAGVSTPPAAHTSDASAAPVDLSSYGVVVAAGGADCKLHLYTCVGIIGATDASAHAPPALRHLISVTGPTDWIRCLAFSASSALVEHFGASNVRGCYAESELHVAAASQEGKLRIWKIKGKGLARKQPASADTSSTTPSVSVPTLGPVVNAGNEDDDELAASDDTGAGAASTGGAPSSASAAAGAATKLDPLAALMAAEDPVLAALQSPRTFTIDLPTSGAAAGGDAIVLTFEVILDALLSGGHDGWVNSVKWHPPVAVATSTSSSSPAGFALMQPPCLVSASMDKKITLWQPDGTATSTSAPNPAGAHADAVQVQAAKIWEGIWTPVMTVGAAGGAVAGFYGGLMTRDCATLFSHGFQGSLHLWRLIPNEADSLTSKLLSSAASGAACGVPFYPSPSSFSVQTLKDEASLNQEPCAQGHCSAVVDMTWSPTGSYLATVSTDFTTRTWAPVAAPAPPSATAKQHPYPLWMEVGRPQIHGYEMASVVLPAHPDPRYKHRMFSAGDEKCPRAFDAPKLFLRSLASLSTPQTSTSSSSASSLTVDEEAVRSSILLSELAADETASRGSGVGSGAGRAEFAYVPELNLTNKAVNSDGVGAPIKDRYQADGRDAIALSGPGGKGSGGDEEGAAIAAAAAAAAALAKKEEESAPASVASSAPVAEDASPASISATAAAANAAAANASATAVAMAAASASGPQVSSSNYERVRHAFATAGGVAPPLDEDEIQNTRWPEVNKLFGHSHEVVALAVNSSGTIVASACKARDEAHANVLLWSVETGEMLQSLPGNKLTVISMAFSPSPLAITSIKGDGDEGEEERLVRSGYISPPSSSSSSVSPLALCRSRAAQSDYLVSVSKDRCICVWGTDTIASAASASSSVEGSTAKTPLPRYHLLTIIKDAHKRIIWSVDFAPLVGDLSTLLSGKPPASEAAVTSTSVFATGARDNVVKLWSLSRSSSSAEAPGASPAAAGDLQVSVAAVLPAAESAVTAVAFAPVARRRTAGANELSLLLAVGEESGAINLWQAIAKASAAGAAEWAVSPVAAVSLCGRHVETVRKLAWRPPVLPLLFLASDKDGTTRTDTGSKQGSVVVKLQLASASMDETIRIHGVRWL